MAGRLWPVCSELEAGQWIGATQKGAPDVSRDAVVKRSFFYGGLAVSGFWHEIDSDRRLDRHSVKHSWVFAGWD